MKANIVGLGNYINNINGDVGKLASTFEKYIGEITADLDVVKARKLAQAWYLAKFTSHDFYFIFDQKENLTALESTLDETSSSLRTGLSAQEDAATAAKGEIASLTSKAYTMKTTLFEQQNELSSLKAGQVRIS